MDKKIIILDSDNAIYNSSQSVLDYYIDILTPIKDVSHIKIIYTSILIKDLSAATDFIDKNVYINLNNYNRLQTNTVSITSNIDVQNYFDNVYIDKSKYDANLAYYAINTPTLNNTLISYSFDNSNEYNSSTDTDSSIHILNPLEPNLKRFNIKIYKQDGTIASNTYIKKVIMKLCIYYNRKKLTMY